MIGAIDSKVLNIYLQVFFYIIRLARRDTLYYVKDNEISPAIEKLCLSHMTMKYVLIMNAISSILNFISVFEWPLKTGFTVRIQQCVSCSLYNVFSTDFTLLYHQLWQGYVIVAVPGHIPFKTLLFLFQIH